MGARAEGGEERRLVSPLCLGAGNSRKSQVKQGKVVARN